MTNPPSQLPSVRIRTLDDAPPITDRPFVLYWMIANRRLRYNYSLQRAVEWAKHLHKPLVIFEALRVGYPWASARFHHFVIEGMADNAEALEGTPVLYYPYVEPEKGHGKGLLHTFIQHSAVVVTDDFPAFMHPSLMQAAKACDPPRLEAIDSNGIFPMYATARTFTTAHSFRRFLHKQLPAHLDDAPLPDPLAGFDLPPPTIPDTILSTWPPLPLTKLQQRDWIDLLPINQQVAKSPTQGGPHAAQARFGHFLEHQLSRYHEDRNHPDKDPSSGLSSYLHFGHISAHEIFARLMQRDGWSTDAIAEKPTGSRNGWWGASEAVEAYLDELITWREIGYNMCATNPLQYDQYESLPQWALTTLHEHREDPRPTLYSLEELESAQSHDPLWNAAQIQLLREGRIHNYLRMLWGKNILGWSKSPQDALHILIHLNNKYALDGRNPNSYSGIFWVLGRYDRAWGPERPIYGKVRYMNSRSTLKKCKLKTYLKTYQHPS